MVLLEKNKVSVFQIFFVLRRETVLKIRLLLDKKKSPTIRYKVILLTKIIQNNLPET